MDYNGKILIKNFDDLRSKRSSLDSVFEECKAFATPSKYGIEELPLNSQQKKKKRPAEIVNDYVGNANYTFARGFFSNLCPPSVPWFSIAPIAALEKNVELKNFLSQASQHYYEKLYASTNFATEIFSAAENLGCIGTICTSIEYDYDDMTIKFKTHDIGEFYVEESKKGVKDTVYRSIPFTALQIINTFNAEGDKIPSKIREYAESLDNEKAGKMFEIIHYVAPNRNRKYTDDGKPELNKRNAPFVSIYIDRDSKEIIRFSGFERNPYTVGCVDTPVHGVYSDSPTQRALRTAKYLNKGMIAMAKATQMQLEPPVALDLAAYSNLVPQYFFEPNAVNLYDSNGGRFNAPQFYTPDGNLAFGMDFLDRLGAVIDNYFSTDLFTMITNLNTQSGRQRTAFEIQQLVNEKNTMILPLVARFLDEFLSPLLVNGFLTLIDHGEFGMLPGIDRKMLKIDYFSPLALAAKRSKISGTMSAIEQISPLLQIIPDALDVLNTDKLVRDIFETAGANSEHLRSEYDIEQIREQRAAEQQQLLQAQQATDIIKSQNLTGEVSDTSLASQLVGGM
jgi:hypothetical protein